MWSQILGPEPGTIICLFWCLILVQDFDTTFWYKILVPKCSTRFRHHIFAPQNRVLQQQNSGSPILVLDSVLESGLRIWCLILVGYGIRDLFISCSLLCSNGKHLNNPWPTVQGFYFSWVWKMLVPFSSLPSFAAWSNGVEK